MTYNYRKLEGRIVEKFGTQRNFAVAAGCCPETVTRKLTNRVAFTQAEIANWSEHLGIDASDIATYFFTPAGQAN